MSIEITDIARLREVIDRIDPNELSRVGIFPLAGEADSDDELRQYIDQAREPAPVTAIPVCSADKDCDSGHQGAAGDELEAFITREAHTDNAPLSFTVHEKSAWSVGVEEGIGAAYRDWESKISALLPGSYYMDPPDGGNVTPLEQLKRMTKDADRWRKTVGFIGARYDMRGYQAFVVSPMLPITADLMKGSVAEHFTNAIDAEINKYGRKSAPYPAHGEPGALEQGDAL